MLNFTGEGKRIKWTNGTGSSVASGAVVVIASIIGILVTTVANAIAGTLAMDGVYSLAAVSAEAWPLGARLFWDATAAKLTQVAGGNTPAGVAAVAKAAAATTAEVILNVGADITPELLNRTWEDVTADKTLDAQDVGKVMNVTADAKTVTLPSTAAGLVFIIRNGGAAGAVAVNVSPAAVDKIMGADLAGVDDKDRINTKATALQGDYIVLLGDGSAGWFAISERGVWAAEA